MATQPADCLRCHKEEPVLNLMAAKHITSPGSCIDEICLSIPGSSSRYPPSRGVTANGKKNARCTRQLCVDMVVVNMRRG
jgi:hypothetical protein